MKLKGKYFHISMDMVRTFFSTLCSSNIGENIQIYSLQITRKCICVPFLPVGMIDLIISPLCRYSPNCHEKLFLKKKNNNNNKEFPPYFTGKTLCHCPSEISCEEAN